MILESEMKNAANKLSTFSSVYKGATHFIDSKKLNEILYPVVEFLLQVLLDNPKKKLFHYLLIPLLKQFLKSLKP